MKHILVALLLCLAFPAGAISLMPMGQTMEGKTTVGSIQIHNNTRSEMRYQVLVDALTVDAEGKRVQVPSSDITFYPKSVATLKPGQTQILRWRRSNVVADQEKVYAVIVSENPLEEPAPKEEGGVVVQTIMGNRMIAPWAFVPPGAKPFLKAYRETNYLVFHNTGNATAPVVELTYAGEKVPGVFMVLPGERLKVKVEGASREVHFTSRGVQSTLTVE